MLAATGVLLAGPKLSKASFAGWILLGISGGLAFLAKPTSAAMLGCMVVIYLAAARKVRLGGPLISVAVAVLFLGASALAIDGSLVGFVWRIVDGLDLGNRLLAGHDFNSIFRWDGINLSHEQKTNFVYLVITAFATTSLGFISNDLLRVGAALIAIVVSASAVATMGGLVSPKISYEPFQGVQFSAVSFGMVVAAMMFPVSARLSRSAVALVVFLAVLPYAYAFGTNTSYGATSARAGLFWLLAGFVICAEFAAANGTWRHLLPAATLALVVSTGILYASMENPYRQTQPLRLQMSAIDITPGKSHLFLPEETAAYIRELHHLSAENGFSAGDPALDLTGVSPGSLYAMGARPLGVAWTPAGYKGSADYFAMALDGETCEAIASSWILTEPGAPDSISPDVLERFGINIATDYLSIGSIRSTRSFVPEHFEQRLLKPVRSPEVARLACESARRARTNPPG
jgi:hypothetical protein